MRKRAALTGFAAAVALALGAQEPVELGPFPTREMFPLFLPTLAYQPADPTPLGEGRWRVSVDHIRANTFEFSDLLKEEAPRDIQGRIRVTREDAQELAAQHPSVPLIFYFDEEIVRTTLRLRYGLTDRMDVWAELPFQWHGGGHLDSFIEGFHKLGFEQFGRDFIERDRLTLAVMSRGNLVFYSEEAIQGKFQDPSVGITRRIAGSGNWLLSATAALKLPLTTCYDEYRSGWDFSLGLTGRWQPTPRHVFYFGGAFIGRPPGSRAYNELAFGMAGGPTAPGNTGNGPASAPSSSSTPRADTSPSSPTRSWTAPASSTTWASTGPSGVRRSSPSATSTTSPTTRTRRIWAWA